MSSVNYSASPLWWGWQKKSGALCSHLFGSSSVCLPVVCYIEPLTMFHPEVLPRFCLVREEPKPFGHQHAAVLVRYFLSLFNPRSGESPGRCLPIIHKEAQEQALHVWPSSRRSVCGREGLCSPALAAPAPQGSHPAGGTSTPRAREGWATLFPIHLCLHSSLLARYCSV